MNGFKGSTLLGAFVVSIMQISGAVAQTPCETAIRQAIFNQNMTNAMAADALAAYTFNALYQMKDIENEPNLKDTFTQFSFAMNESMLKKKQELLQKTLAACSR